MSIWAAIGIPGSGKSFYAVQRMLAYMAEGGIVFTNIRLHGVEQDQEIVSFIEGCKKELLLAETDFERAKLAFEKAGRKLKEAQLDNEDLENKSQEEINCESLFDLAKVGFDNAKNRLAGVKKRISEKQVDEWYLGPSSRVIKVLKKEYRWDYQKGQYHYIDLTSWDSNFLNMIPRGSKGKRILLVLDEVNEWFDSLDGGKLKRDEAYGETFKFLRLSRHYFIDVLFLLQDFSTLNARLRGLVEGIWKMTDMQKMRVAGVPFAFPFKLFLWQQYDKTGKHCVKTLTWPKEQCVFDCYDSFCEFGAIGLSGAAVRTDFSGAGRKGKEGDKMTIWDRLLVVACCAGVVFFLGGFKKAGSGGGVVTVTNTVSLVSSPLPAGSAKVEKEDPRPMGERVSVEYCTINYSEAQADKWAYAQGRLFRVGMAVPQGRVVDVQPWGIRIVGSQGEHFIYNAEPQFTDEGRKEENGSKAAGGRLGAVSPE